MLQVYPRPQWPLCAASVPSSPVTPVCCKCTLVPKPHSKNQERSLVLLANFHICAESACYATITCLTWSRGSQVLLMRLIMRSMLASFPFSRMWFLYSKRRLLTQHIWEFLQVIPDSFPDFWVGPGDEATAHAGPWTMHILLLATYVAVPDRNRVLFRRIFRAHHWVWHTVVLHFR